MSKESGWSKDLIKAFKECGLNYPPKDKVAKEEEEFHINAKTIILNSGNYCYNPFYKKSNS